MEEKEAYWFLERSTPDSAIFMCSGCGHEVQVFDSQEGSLLPEVCPKCGAALGKVSVVWPAGADIRGDNMYGVH